jgi:hypothetical protein
MAESKLCSDATLEFGDFTCYNSSSNQILIEVVRGDKDVKLSGINLIIYGKDTSKSFMVKRYAVLAGLKEYGSDSISLPASGESRTYVITGITSPESVSATALVNVSNKEKLCKTNVQTTLNTC